MISWTWLCALAPLAVSPAPAVATAPDNPSTRVVVQVAPCPGLPRAEAVIPAGTSVVVSWPDGRTCTFSIEKDATTWSGRTPQRADGPAGVVTLPDAARDAFEAPRVVVDGPDQLEITLTPRPHRLLLKASDRAIRAPLCVQSYFQAASRPWVELSPDEISWTPATGALVLLPPSISRGRRAGGHAGSSYVRISSVEFGLLDHRLLAAHDPAVPTEVGLTRRAALADLNRLLPAVDGLDDADLDALRTHWIVTSRPDDLGLWRRGPDDREPAGESRVLVAPGYVHADLGADLGGLDKALGLRPGRLRFSIVGDPRSASKAPMPAIRVKVVLGDESLDEVEVPSGGEPGFLLPKLYAAAARLFKRKGQTARAGFEALETEGRLVAEFLDPALGRWTDSPKGTEHVVPLSVGRLRSAPDRRPIALRVTPSVWTLAVGGDAVPEARLQSFDEALRDWVDVPSATYAFTGKSLVIYPTALGGLLGRDFRLWCEGGGSPALRLSPGGSVNLTSQTLIFRLNIPGPSAGQQAWVRIDYGDGRPPYVLKGLVDPAVPEIRVPRRGLGDLAGVSGLTAEVRAEGRVPSPRVAVVTGGVVAATLAPDDGDRHYVLAFDPSEVPARTQAVRERATRVRQDFALGLAQRLGLGTRPARGVEGKVFLGPGIDGSWSRVSIDQTWAGSAPGPRASGDVSRRVAELLATEAVRRHARLRVVVVTTDAEPAVDDPTVRSLVDQGDARVVTVLIRTQPRRPMPRLAGTVVPLDIADGADLDVAVKSAVDAVAAALADAPDPVARPAQRGSPGTPRESPRVQSPSPHPRSRP